MIKKGSENLVVDHLSRLINKEVTQEELDIQDEFPDEFLLVVGERPWFADIANYKATWIIPNKRGGTLMQLLMLDYTLRVFSALST